MPLSKAQWLASHDPSSQPPTVPQIKNKATKEALLLKHEHDAAQASFGWQSTCRGLSLRSPTSSFPPPSPLALTLPHTGAFRPVKSTATLHPSSSASHAALHHDGAHWAPFGPAGGARASPVRTLSVRRMGIDVARRDRGRAGWFGCVCGGSAVRPSGPVRAICDTAGERTNLDACTPGRPLCVAKR